MNNKHELTLDMIKEEAAGFIWRICIGRRMSTDMGFDTEELDQFIGEEMRRSMDEIDNMPFGKFAQMILNEVIAMESGEIDWLSMPGSPKEN